MSSACNILHSELEKLKFFWRRLNVIGVYDINTGERVKSNPTSVEARCCLATQIPTKESAMNEVSCGLADPSRHKFSSWFYALLQDPTGVGTMRVIYSVPDRQTGHVEVYEWEGNVFSAAHQYQQILQRQARNCGLMPTVKRIHLTLMQVNLALESMVEHAYAYDELKTTRDRQRDTFATLRDLIVLDSAREYRLSDFLDRDALGEKRAYLHFDACGDDVDNLPRYYQVGWFALRDSLWYLLFMSTTLIQSFPSLNHNSVLMDLSRTAGAWLDVLYGPYTKAPMDVWKI